MIPHTLSDVSVRRITARWLSVHYIGVSLKILSLLSFCYFLIGTSNLSLKARCCYRRRLFFAKRIWNMCYYLCVSFVVYLHSICIYVLSHQHIGHGVLKEKAFDYILKRASICHVYLWKPLQISSCLALFFLISSHGVAAKPATWVAANVTGRFTARTFHSRKLAGVFEEKKRSCVHVNAIMLVFTVLIYF